MSQLASLLNQAREASLAGHHLQAIFLCEQARSLSPEGREAIAYHGLVLWRARSWLRAIRLLSQGLAHFPAQPELAVALLDCWVSLGLPRQALAVAARLPAELKVRPAFESVLAMAEAMQLASDPGEEVRSLLVRQHNEGAFDELSELLPMMLQEWPTWAFAHALLASTLRHQSGLDANSVDLTIRPEESADAAQQRWEAVLTAQRVAHHAATLRHVEAALALDPQLPMALQVEARTRFEADAPLSAAQFGRLQSASPDGLDGPYPLRNLAHVQCASLALRPLDSAQVVEMRDPVTRGGKFSDAKSVGRALLNPRYVAEARDASVAGGSDVVLLREQIALCDNLTHALGELTHWRQDRWIGLRSPTQLLLKKGQPRRDQEGTTVNMLGATTDRFGHWLMDYLPRLRALEAQLDLRGVTFLVDASMPTSHLQALSLLVGHEVRTLALAPAEVVKVERLVFTGPEVYFPSGLIAGTPDFPSLAPSSATAMRFLRERMQDRLCLANATPGRRLFVKRASSLRKLVNEDEVCEQLERLFGFEPVNPGQLDFAEQVRLFNEAEVVIGAHGSALSNCVFCQPGARLVQLCTPYAGNLPSWASSLRELGVGHEFVIGREIAGSHAVRHHWDFLVDPQLLVRAVTELFATAR